MTAILSLSTYRLDARHGGARRVRALRDAYVAAGARYAHVTAARGIDGRDASPDDLVLDLRGPPLPHERVFGDMIAGAQAAHDEAAFGAVRALAARLRPRVVQMEQPFVYPIVHRLRAEGVMPGAKLIYSAQNLEAPLRRDLIRALRLRGPFLRRWRIWAREMERRALAEADLVLAVSRGEAEAFAARTRAPIIVAPNGATPRVAAPERARAWRARLPGPFAAIVGSAHPPNIHGFVELLVEGGMPFLPPRPVMVVCGAMAAQIGDDPRARGHREALARRALLVPEIDDEDLAAVLEAAAFVAVPITYGTGTNLKTAEALAARKPVLTTPHGARGFERFIGTPGFTVAPDRQEFRDAFTRMLTAVPVPLDAADRALRETVHWRHALADVWPAVRAMIEAA